MLASRCPPARRDRPVPVVRSLMDRDVHLDCRRLVLVRSYFAPSNAIALLAGRLPQVQVFPAARLALLDDDRLTRAGVDQALGSTRTTLLEASRAGRTTTSLARHGGLSVASARELARVLGDVGLLTSSRHDRAVCISRPLNSPLTSRALWV